MVDTPTRSWRPSRTLLRPSWPPLRGSRAGGFLGALVRALPDAHADAGPRRGRLRRPLHARQAEHRRGAAHRRPFRRPQHPHGDAVSPRAGGRAVRGRAAGSRDPGAARQAPRRAGGTGPDGTTALLDEAATQLELRDVAAATEAIRQVEVAAPTTPRSSCCAPSSPSSRRPTLIRTSPPSRTDRERPVRCGGTSRLRRAPCARRRLRDGPVRMAGAHAARPQVRRRPRPPQPAAGLRRARREP